MSSPGGPGAGEVRLEEVHLLIRKNGTLYRVRVPAGKLEAAFARADAKRRYAGTYPEPPRVRLVKVEEEGEPVVEAELQSAVSDAEAGGGEPGPVCAKLADCSIICWG